MNKLVFLFLGLSFIPAQSAEIKKYNVSNTFERPQYREVHELENDNDLIDNEEFIVAKEEEGCKIVVFHEKSGTGFVDKSLCEMEE